MNPPDPATARPDYASLQQAAEWFAVLSSGTATEQQRQYWQSWLDARVEHRNAWARVEGINQRLDTLGTAMDQHTAASTLQTATKTVRMRRRSLGTLGALFALLIGGKLIHGLPPVRHTLAAWRADYRTGIGEQFSTELADGSHLWLDTDSAADVHYDGQLRRIILHGGALLVRTAPDTARRPLVVDTRHGRLLALGTWFSVRHNDGHIHLSVFEGTVEIQPANPGAATQRVATGQQASFTHDASGPLQPLAQPRPQWQDGLLIADEMPLADFLAELGRYRRGHLGCAPEVAHLKVVGAYPLHDTDRALELLATALPLRIRRTLPWWVTLEAR
ncbi:FecR domain-containing protein [Thauera sp. Sel9]|uniref:FecR domain-containing protein n=1 Tax=Thauera sp. Sel9 TaxID=2974299 RepID=UPI0021E125B6|nr:FecR domain-containing protein [Thauera sp. Sel9]MCV2216357.1 FecR domain-containing protein [Thauera sp. Sel9]